MQERSAATLTGIFRYIARVQIVNITAPSISLAVTTTTTMLYRPFTPTAQPIIRERKNVSKRTHRPRPRSSGDTPREGVCEWREQGGAVYEGGRVRSPKGLWAGIGSCYHVQLMYRQYVASQTNQREPNTVRGSVVSMVVSAELAVETVRDLLLYKRDIFYVTSHCICHPPYRRAPAHTYWPVCTILTVTCVSRSCESWTWVCV